MTTLDPADTVGVPVVCESCGTALSKPDEERAADTVKNHNEKRHDGEEVAKVIDSPTDVDTLEAPAGQRDDFVRQIMGLLDR